MNLRLLIILLSISQTKPLENHAVERTAILSRITAKTRAKLANTDDYRITLFDNSNLWPGGRIPYLIDPRYFSNPDIEVIYKAFALIEQQTCIRFMPAAYDDPYYVLLTNGTACSSLVGRRTYIRAQKVTLPYWCFKFGNVIHELIHAIGFGHEQSRPDRDKYVDIQWPNIYHRWWHAFEEDADGHYLLRYALPYDYNSILHYGPYDFSVDEVGGREAIKSKSKYFPVTKNNQLSPLDLLKINLLYKCTYQINQARQQCFDFMPECHLVRREDCERVDYLQKACRRSCRTCHVPFF